MITKRQIKKIHALKNRLGWSDEEYREYLMRESDGFATSCKDLREDEAERLIRKMEFLAVAKGVWQRYEGVKRYEGLGNREGMATPRQLRMIEAMWKEVSKYRRNKEARERSLRHFLRRIVGVDRLEFLEDYQVKKVVEAIKRMKGVRYA